ncbi:archaeosortase/exosortase family protein [Sphingomonas floccifaciens]|uniref:Archaeosortase/exosortase family protein n=1 Tax=Sphingomonas floccifaciens TaxID=1844115 RepID=A0ABW4N7L6_9SPHN
MIPLRVALTVAFVACWDAWRLLLVRIDDPTTALLLVPGVALIGWRLIAAEGAVRALPVAAGLVAYAIFCITGPALLQIGVASGVVVCLAIARLNVPKLPLAGLAALLLPILPTLDFLLAYPLRRLSAIITVALLRMNGIPVSLDGIALEWRGQQLLFDGPCSGVRMLWASLVLASLIAIARQMGALGYTRTLTLAVGVAVFGNALRAASLFYVENGFVTGFGGPVAHEAVGLLAFAMIAAAMLVTTRKAMA